MAKKKKLFSGRGYNPRGSVKRFNKRVLPKIMSYDNINDLTLEEIRDFKAFIRSQRKEIEQELKTPEAQRTATGKEAIKEGIFNTSLQDNPVVLFREYSVINQFRESIQIDYEALRMGEQDKAFSELVEDDKWTILRRLAVYDTRLNIDRSYASDVLKEIEDIIVQANDGESKFAGMTYGEIADILVSEYLSTNTYSFMNTWDEDMFEVSYDEDDSLFVNRNFHGRERAKTDRDRYIKWHNKQLTSYDPSYTDPSSLVDLDWGVFDE